MFADGMGPTYLNLLLRGLLFTLVISAASLLLGSLIGFLLGAARATSIPWLRATIGVYVEVVRSLPLLILLFLVFYGLPTVTGFQIEPLAAAILTQGVYMGAYMTEVVRAGIEALPRGQWEASQALGFGYVRTMRFVVLPQALRILVPPAVGLCVANVKDSSLASIIGVTEVTQTALAIREQTFSNWDVLGALALSYFALNALVSWGGSALEARLRRSERFQPPEHGVESALPAGETIRSLENA